MPHIMLDLETLGTAPGCAILSVGLMEFDSRGQTGKGLYVIINLASCVKAGLKEDPATVNWWMSQAAEARTILQQVTQPTAMPLGAALAGIDGWLSQFCEGDQERKNLFIWGNGSDFDQPILSHAYDICGFNRPWNFYNNRCYRTLKGFQPWRKIQREGGVHHNAIDDAKAQADHAAAILVDMKLWKPYVAPPTEPIAELMESKVLTPEEYTNDADAAAAAEHRA